MKNSIILLLLAVMATFTACKKSADPEPFSKTPGYFILTPMQECQGIKSALKQTSDESNPGFDLGEIKVSREYFFILTNGGDEPLFDVRFSTSVIAFEVSPQKISKIPGRTTLSNGAPGGFIPVITLGVTHGKRLNGMGFAPLLPMDSNNCTITISGKTLQNGDTITVSQTVEIFTFARVMDIRVFDSESEIDLAHPPFGALFTGPMGTETYRLYKIAGNYLEVENTGNIPIIVSNYDMNNLLNSITIEPGIRKGITFATSLPSNSLVFDGQGTITHPERIQLFDDGRGCFCISNGIK